NEGGAHLDRRQPAHGNVRDHAAREAERDVRHIGEAIEVRAAGREHQLRLGADQVVDDREVVGGEVPDDVDVVLKEPQVDPRGVVVVERTQHAAVHQLLDLAHGAVEQKGVVDHDL